MQKQTVVTGEWCDTETATRELRITERTLQKWAAAGYIEFKTIPNGRRRTRLYSAINVEKLKVSGPPRARHQPNRPDEPAPIRVAKVIPQAVDILAAMRVFFEQQQATIKLFFEQRQIETNREHEAEFLTITESAAFLRLPKAFLHRAVKEGRLPAIQAGGWRIRRSQLTAFQG